MDWGLVNEVLQWIVLVAAIYMGVFQAFGMYEMQEDLDELTFRSEGRNRDEAQKNEAEPEVSKPTGPVELKVHDRPLSGEKPTI